MEVQITRNPYGLNRLNPSYPHYDFLMTRIGLLGLPVRVSGRLVKLYNEPGRSYLQSQPVAANGLIVYVLSYCYGHDLYKTPKRQ